MTDCYSFGEKVVKAKKQHRCEICGGLIEVGDKYTKYEGIWDGSHITMKSHCECLTVGRMLYDLIPMLASGSSCEYTYEDLYDNVVTLYKKLFPDGDLTDIHEQSKEIMSLTKEEIQKRLV